MLELIEALRDEAEYIRASNEWNYDTIEVKVGHGIRTALLSIADRLEADLAQES